MTEQQGGAGEQTGLDVDEARMSGPDFESEPLAGEGTDSDEATITKGPRAGGSGATPDLGKAGTGTTADEVGGTSSIDPNLGKIGKLGSNDT